MIKGLQFVLIFQMLVVSGTVLAQVNTFTVNAASGTAAGSLPWAINQANATPNLAGGNDVIVFAAGITTVLLAADLVSPTEPVTINASNGSTVPTVALNGANRGFLISNAGAAGTIIKGFAIYSCTDGIEINGVSNITIENCWFGLNLSTLAAYTTPTTKITSDGIYINNSSNIIVGGTTPQARNVISACSAQGINITVSTNCSIIGNYIGTSVDGLTTRTNTLNGIYISNSSSITIGGASLNHRNVISGNTENGIFTDNCDNSNILNNFIGVNVTGTSMLGNTASGIYMQTGSNGNTIGGSNYKSRNIISGNVRNGVDINGSTGNIIKGNFIGPDVTGKIDFGNTLSGLVLINSTNTSVGGPLVPERNVISGNTNDGIFMSNADNNTFENNFMGVDSTGAMILSNGNSGIFGDATSDGNTIGGTSYNKRNIISGNLKNGIAFSGGINNIIKGNFIGTDVTGKIDLGNTWSGGSFIGCNTFTIGGSTSAERNIISGNSDCGIYVDNSDNNIFQNNYIGTDSTGNGALGNGNHGILMVSTSDNNDFLTNVISSNSSSGINAEASSTASDIYGNIIGLGANGTTALGNGQHGIRLANGSGSANIGGTGAGQRNYIAKSTFHAVFLDGSDNCVVKNNYIGSDITGLIAKGNEDSGVFPLNSNGTIIGGAGTNEGNLICCSNSENGIRIQVSDNTTMYGNLVGVNKDGNSSTGFGNFAQGIYLLQYDAGTSTNNIIGGTAAGQANTISYNGGNGVHIYASSGTANFNPIKGNKINCNGGEGIFLEGSTIANQGIAAPVITTSGANSISGTGINGNTIHIYRNVTGGSVACNCEGEIYVGSTTVVGTTWSYTHSLGLSASAATSVTATQTNASNSSSQFTACSSPPLPVTLFDFYLSRKNEKVLVSWVTSSEVNNNHFTVERSSDGKTFEPLGNVRGAGNSKEYNTYSFEDVTPIQGITYYRLLQVDNDGKKSYSEIKAINISTDQFLQIFPNPSLGVFSMNLNSESELVDVLVLNSLGQEIYKFSETISSGKLNKTIDLSALPNGIYYISILTGEQQIIEKIIKE
jgi:parallel beta-helix repeat protein